MVMLELAASERARPLPPPTFSAPFSSPTLQWPRKKRQRYPSPFLDPHNLSTRRRLASPSPDPPPSSSSPSSAAAPDSRRRASPSPSPAPPSSDRHRAPIRSRTPRKEDTSASGLAPADGPPRARGKPGDAQKKKDKEEDDEEARAGSEEGCVERMHLRPRAAGGGATGRKKKKVEMWVSLSRDEIEEDYYSITGCKLPRRPKRRPRTAVHPTILNRIFPGSWLPNTVTLEMYRVHEHPEQRKR